MAMTPADLTKLAPLLDRIPAEWGRSISTPAEWDDVLLAANTLLAAIDPDYRIHQIKVKFGGLRYYFAPSDLISDANLNTMRQIVAATEAACDRIQRRQRH